MPDLTSNPLKLTRANGFILTCAKTDNRYDVSVTGGPQLTEGELAAIDAYIGEDPDGLDTLRKLRLR